MWDEYLDASDSSMQHDIVTAEYTSYTKSIHLFRGDELTVLYDPSKYIPKGYFLPWIKMLYHCDYSEFDKRYWLFRHINICLNNSSFLYYRENYIPLVDEIMEREINYNRLTVVENLRYRSIINKLGSDYLLAMWNHIRVNILDGMFNPKDNILSADDITTFDFDKIFYVKRIDVDMDKGSCKIVLVRLYKDWQWKE